MKQFNFIRKSIWIILLSCKFSCTSTEKYYTADDFAKVQKADAHFHYVTTDGRFVDFAVSQNIHLISPNVDSEIPVDEQWRISKVILKAKPSGISFLGTFSVDDFALPGFADSVIAKIDNCMNEGASGIKIWKNIGMVLKDSSGQYVMADNPAFAPIFQHLEKNRIPLLAHLGEPRDCWLSEEEMTDEGDKSYYKEHPQYHMFLHPEMPSYEDQIQTRDKLLEMYPDMVFVGAHLGSLEWNVDELAKRLDKYPNFSVDMAARIGHLRNQSKENRDRVRGFMIRYQDRLLYATDNSMYDDPLKDYKNETTNLLNVWKGDWIYFATDSTVRNVRGLKLPADVIDKIFYANSKKIYKF
jgi:predicted TIM-barrel fold metal-dependent hydrolase